MKRFLALLITLILFVFSVSYAESSFFIGEELPEHSIYATAVVGDQYVLYDTMGPHYCLYRGETFLSDLPSLTNFDTNDDMLLIYRSALCVVSDEQSFYGVEMNLDKNYGTSTIKFGRGEVHRLNFEDNTTELVAELDVSPAIVKQEGSSIESMMRFIGAALSGNNLYLVFEVPFSQVESGVFFADEADIEHFALRYELGNPTPQRIPLAGGAKLIAAQGSTILYSALTADSNDVQICMLDTTTDSANDLRKRGAACKFCLRHSERQAILQSEWSGIRNGRDGKNDARRALPVPRHSGAVPAVRQSDWRMDDRSVGAAHDRPEREGQHREALRLRRS